MINTILKLLKAVGGFIAHTVIDFFKWLRRPCGKLKAVAAVLAVVSLVTGLNSYTRGIKVSELQNRIVVIVDEHESRVATLREHIDERDARLNAIAQTLALETAKLKRLEEEARAAMTNFERQVEAAEREAILWQDRYASRPESCTAAIEFLDAACSDLEGY